MKKIYLLLAFVLTSTIGIGLYAQSVTLTNKYSFTSSVDVVQTINFDTMINVVSSAGVAMTNNSNWAPWIPKYIDDQIYTTGLTTNNVTDIRVEWTDPKNKPTWQARYIHQGMPDIWDGIHYIKLPLAKDRILAGQRLHVWLKVQSFDLVLPPFDSTNIVYNAVGIVKKVVVLPPTKPLGY